ncbi:MAG: hypothetical protein V7K58_31260 [Nostoc sp.]
MYPSSGVISYLVIWHWALGTCTERSRSIGHWTLGTCTERSRSIGHWLFSLSPLSLPASSSPSSPSSPSFPHSPLPTPHSALILWEDY